MAEGAETEKTLFSGTVPLAIAERRIKHSWELRLSLKTIVAYIPANYLQPRARGSGP
jgi:hypothetical protein